jgi:phosphoribosylanthranilate isomerase
MNDVTKEQLSMKTMNNNPDTVQTPQIKICGLTNAQEACDCAALGADAIGVVFYPKSPRHVTKTQARDIVRALPPGTPVVGVFVNNSFGEIMKKVEACGLNAVQLHGQEPTDLIDKLVKENLLVIKALFEKANPGFKDAPRYRASALLVECGKGKLPGGNALSWEWGKAGGIGKTYPLILAGGMTEENVAHAIRECAPDAIDISSGVESVPGRKDIHKVTSFISKVASAGLDSTTQKRKLRRIFHARS